MNIIISSIKRNLRDKSSILGCIFLIMLLPNIFATMFSLEDINEDINLNIIGDKNNQIVSSYISMIEEYDEINESINITKNVSETVVHKSKDYDKNQSNINVYIDDKNKSIKFEEDKKISVGQEIIRELTHNFTLSISEQEALYKEGYIEINNNELMKISYPEIEEEDRISNVDYKKHYGVIMLQMAILAISTLSLKNVFYIKENIGDKIKSSPMKISTLISLEIIGSFISIFMQGMLMLIIVHFMYGVNINTNNIALLSMVIGLTSILSVCIGIFASAVSHTKQKGESLCSMMVSVMTILSDHMVLHLDDFSEKIGILKYNPINLIGEEMLLLTSSNTTNNLSSTISTTLVICLGLVLVSILILRKRVVK